MDNVQTGYAAINGARIYYETAGRGAAVTLLHAGVADSRMWDAAFAALAAHHRVLRYDLRGFGRTEAPEMPYSHVDDLIALLDQVGIGQTALIGCSMGGMVAMDTVLTHPERATALAMVCSTPGGYPMNGEPSPLIMKLIAAQRQGDLEAMADLAVLIWAVGEGRQPEQVDAKVRDLVREMSLIGFQKAASLGEARAVDPPAVERLDEVRVPTLIIDGAADSPAIHAAGETMASSIRGARRVMLDDTAHLPSMEHPGEFNVIVAGWLKEVVSG